MDIESRLSSASGLAERDSTNHVAESSPLIATKSGASDILPKNTQSLISEAVPKEADGFDWQEDVNELADGMAALSVEPQGTGYLGTYSRYM